jgi:hypothetical protein
MSPRKKVAGGYREVRRLPHGMEPNFVHQLTWIADDSVASLQPIFDVADIGEVNED